MLDESLKRSRRRLIHDVDAVDTGVLPELELVSDTLRCSDDAAVVRERVCEIRDTRFLAGIGFFEQANIALKPFDAVFVDRPIRIEGTEVDSHVSADVGRESI